MLNKNLCPAFLFIFLVACQPPTIKHEVDVKPIHITIDVNVKIDKELDKLFDETKTSTMSDEEKHHIETLVEKGDATITDRGYFEYSGKDQYNEELVNKENRSLKNEYQIIADKEKVSIGVVEKSAAKKMKQVYRSGAASYANEPSKEVDELSPGGKYYALIIGIAQYKHYPILDTPINDAMEVKKILKDVYGFETIMLLDDQATRSNIISSLSYLRKKLYYGDSLIIYYAGHGELVKEKAYWLPIDAQEDDWSNWIFVETITAILKSSAASHVLVVSDSCYSGAFRKGAVNTTLSGSANNYYIKKMLNKKSRILLSSGGKEPVVDAGESGHSVFANAFITGLTEIDKEVFTVDELFVNWIREPVAGNAKQTPANESIEDSGHEGGTFIFFKKNLGD